MRPYAESEGLIGQEEVTILGRIRDVVKALPELELYSGREKRDVSCHLLARAIGKLFHLTVQDGYFASPGFPHSWLVNERGKIFDVYPIAQVGGPVLFDNFWLGPWTKLFMQKDLGKDVFYAEFNDHLHQLERAVEQTMERLNIARG
ncbi:MAG: hypothetical protein WCF77_01560 [Minisyncoccia bacterium]